MMKKKHHFYAKMSNPFETLIKKKNINKKEKAKAKINKHKNGIYQNQIIRCKWTASDG